MKIATNEGTTNFNIGGALGTLALVLTLLAPSMDLNAQVIESEAKKFWNQYRGSIDIVSSEMPVPPTYSKFPEAHLAGDWSLSCGATIDSKDHEGFYLRAPKHENTLGKAQAATFSTTFTGFGRLGADSAAAVAAVNRAIETWSTILTSGVTINLAFNIDSLAPGVLGSASPCFFSCLSGPPIPASIDGMIIAGGPLAEALAGPINAPGACDVAATFSSEFSNWHFGPGPAPPGTADFESVAAHEIGHGIDFRGLHTVVLDSIAPGPVFDTTGTFFRGPVGTPGVVGDGLCASLIPDASRFLAVDAYNYYLQNGISPVPVEASSKSSAFAGQVMHDTTVYPVNSAALGAAMMGFDGGVWWADSALALFGATGPFETLGTAANGGVRPALYAPATFSQGASISHLDDATFDATLDNMMTHAISPAELARGPGPVTCGMLADKLWTISAQCNGLALPVELIAFEARIVGESGLLSWTTATEDDNAGFEIEHRVGIDGGWNMIGFVEGAGRSIERLDYEFPVANLDFGRHFFRLKQIDFDGTFAYSYEVEAILAVPDQFVLSEAYPNPFNPSTNLNLVVGRTQEVTAELFDVSGRKVATLMRGEAVENEQLVVTVDGALLPSGIYMVRFTGENFVANRKIVLLK
jgi:hypothetical protein